MSNKRLIAELEGILTESASERHVYHVTYHKHLASIAKDGLRPGAGQSIGQGAGTKQHSSKRVFATSGEGVGFWHGRAEDHANDRSDHPHKDGHTPVVLRVKVPKGHRLTADKVGTDDAGGAKAFHTKKSIPPEHIEVFHKDAWHPVKDHHDKIDPAEAYHRDSDGTHWLKADHENPLHPKPEHLGLKS